MNHTRQFIEDAIKGGYLYTKYHTPSTVSYLVKVFSESPHSSLLDPFAWKAVGKTRGWDTKMYCPVCGNGTGRYDEAFMDKWLYQQHRFVDFLASGKSIEQALEALK